MRVALTNASRRPFWKRGAGRSVSSDIVNHHASRVFNSQLTKVGGSLDGVVGWRGNKGGYASRLAERAVLIGNDG